MLPRSPRPRTLRLNSSAARKCENQFKNTRPARPPQPQNCETPETNSTDKFTGGALRATLAAIVESPADAIIGKTLDGVITSWSTGATRMYGYDGAEMTGHNVSEIIPPDRADELPSILALLRQRRQIEHFDTYRVRKGQRKRAVVKSDAL